VVRCSANPSTPPLNHTQEENGGGGVTKGPQIRDEKARYRQIVAHLVCRNFVARELIRLAFYDIKKKKTIKKKAYNPGGGAVDPPKSWVAIRRVKTK